MPAAGDGSPAVRRQLDGVCDANDEAVIRVERLVFRSHDEEGLIQAQLKAAAIHVACPKGRWGSGDDERLRAPLAES